ncbi:DHA2 family efflux MFS transporter permease subunit [Kutzneria buriramensis]|uniref:EmrB/QacA subfamily drug resistance transporter n=1 Tax=Kutzneria buriramensis TaxID=1045776 RepID=A0A3E0HDC8_9PSEU|nr:DHA2 family efflux MFS transporter permease subunit [Kutzneria buriramensis]REH42857.1 EmrB/QacA subfamily drug resistance transporter [Kutzneria buriramensis]
MGLRQLSPRVVVSVVFVAALFVNILDTTIVNVALPTIAGQFRVSPADADAVVVGYLLSLALVIPASGWLGDRFGSKRVFLTALAIFTVASALCGLAQSLPQLVAFRLLQGLGGGMLAPVGLAMLYRVFPLAERMRAMRVLILPTAVAPAMGPVLGGLLVDTLTWRWVFYVNLPVGVLTFLFGLFLLKEHREPGAGRFDLAGFALSGFGFALLMYALTEGSSRGWGSPSILITGALGVLLLTATVLVELRVPSPMLDLRLFSDRLFRTINVVQLVSTAGFLGTLFVFPLLYQAGLGVSAWQTGLTTFPEAVGVLVGTQIASRVYSTLGPRLHIVLGVVNAAVAMMLLTLLGPATPQWLAMLIMFYLGLGMSNNFNPAQTAAFAQVPRASTGAASTLYNSGRQAGSAVGVAVLGSVLAAAGAGPGHLVGYHVAFAVAAGLMIAAAVAALFVKDGDAAATMASPVRPEAAAEAVA